MLPVKQHFLQQKMYTRITKQLFTNHFDE